MARASVGQARFFAHGSNGVPWGGSRPEAWDWDGSQPRRTPAGTSRAHYQPNRDVAQHIC